MSQLTLVDGPGKTEEVTTGTVSRVMEHRFGIGERVKMSNSRESEQAVRPFYFEIDEIESFHVMVLSRANELIAHKCVSTGGPTGCVADPKVIFRYALSIPGAAGLIVSHNHPSGNMKASAADIDLTKKIKEGCKLLEMQLLDHVIISPVGGRFFSFADEGMI